MNSIAEQAEIRRYVSQDALDMIKKEGGTLTDPATQSIAVRALRNMGLEYSQIKKGQILKISPRQYATLSRHFERIETADTAAPALKP